MSIPLPCAEAQYTLDVPLTLLFHTGTPDCCCAESSCCIRASDGAALPSISSSISSVSSVTSSDETPPLACMHSVMPYKLVSKS